MMREIVVGTVSEHTTAFRTVHMKVSKTSDISFAGTAISELPSDKQLIVADEE